MSLRNFIPQIIKENLVGLHFEKYPTTDDVDHVTQLGKNGETGMAMELSDGRKLSYGIVRITPTYVYGYFTCNGYDFEIFELPSTDPSKYFSKFKRKITNKYDQTILDETDIKKQFNNYANMMFNK